MQAFFATNTTVIKSVFTTSKYFFYFWHEKGAWLEEVTCHVWGDIIYKEVIKTRGPTPKF